MAKNPDSMSCENPEYKKKHVPVKRVGKAVNPVPVKKEGDAK